MTKKNLQQHRNLVKVQSADALRSATDELKHGTYKYFKDIEGAAVSLACGKTTSTPN